MACELDCLWVSHFFNNICFNALSQNGLTYNYTYGYPHPETDLYLLENQFLSDHIPHKPNRWISNRPPVLGYLRNIRNV